MIHRSHDILCFLFSPSSLTYLKGIKTYCKATKVKGGGERECDFNANPRIEEKYLPV